ncbi:MAG: trehalose-6-phosphate synthase [Candidatus Aenigmarchaeota archaeon]|nr:trehalose-6-phosphate synthase [Candidatus Aenigmarchaeota archaeon]
MLRKTVLEKAESINDRFRHDDILPVIIKNEEIKYPDNMLLFRDANIVMVPSLKDGFHLVPVEAILANSHLPYTERALVVMSPNCGASYVLQDFNETDGLVRVNPLDTTGSTNEILHVYNNAYHISDSLIDFAKRMDVRAWQAANMNALYEIKQHKRTLALR